jgi:hypothetical protein
MKLISKYFFLVLLVTIFHLMSFKPENQLLTIDYFGEISLPDQMEIQGGSYKEGNDSYSRNIIGNLENHQSLVFQQKGLNSLEKNSFNTYARVVIDTYFGEKGKYKLLSETNNLDQIDINNYNNNFEIQVNTIWPKAKIQLVSSTETLITKIGNFYCTKHNYIRQMENSKPVFVEVYRVQNNDRVHLISFSYRSTEIIQWRTIMNKIIESINIKKI